MGVANKFFSSRTAVPVANFIGEKGRLFYDEATGTIYLSDGVTPGGIAVSSGGSSTPSNELISPDGTQTATLDNTGALTIPGPVSYTHLTLPTIYSV